MKKKNKYFAKHIVKKTNAIVESTFKNKLVISNIPNTNYKTIYIYEKDVSEEFILYNNVSIINIMSAGFQIDITYDKIFSNYTHKEIFDFIKLKSFVNDISKKIL